MCGICGFVDEGLDASVAERLLDRMTKRLEHRGPDDGGAFRDGAVWLGHRRLAIIDRGAGRQPMRSVGGRATIVFNGEIYNYVSLREDLRRKGHRFATQSDTEVILNAYAEYGEACVEHLRGMFAFAIWDGHARTLFLARDRVGIKPLYYGWDGRRFAFASEMKALLEHPAWTRAIDPKALDEYLTFLYVPAPRTIFRGMFKLRPGHTLTVSDRGLTERPYWDLSFEPDESLTEPDQAARLRETIREAVSLHLVSEVPLGAFLSGGIDSSAVVGLMAAAADHPVSTASIGFREAAFDELPYARLTADRWRTQSAERCVDPDAAGLLDSLAWFFDEPFADSSMIPTYYVSQLARERVTVALSGDGGDENFAGYRRYRFDLLENRMRGVLPDPLRRVLFGALGGLYPKADWLPRALRAKTLFQNLARSPERAYFHTMSWYGPAMKARLYRESLKREIGDHDAFSVMAPHFERSRGWHPLSRVQYVDIKTYLPDDILTKVDRASMAHSLEVRVPLLDHRVMECAASIPPRLHLRRGEGKYLFKRAVADLVDPAILRKRKSGFSIPLARWLRGPLAPIFEERVLSRDAFVAQLFDPKPLHEWWRQHQRHTRDYAHHLWAIMVLEAWAQRHLDRGNS